MPQSVVDHSTNAADNIAHAAKVVGRGHTRRAVFNAIYTGKKQIKTARDIAKTSKLNEIRVLQEAKKLSAKHIVTATKVGKYTAYQKIDFFHHRKKQILDPAASSKKLDAFPTKVNPVSKSSNAVRVSVQLRIPKIKHKAHHVTVNDLDSASAVTPIGARDHNKIGETKFKNGAAAILGEQGPFKDWGGESRELSSTRVRLGGKRRIAAFAFQGPGQTGKLIHGKIVSNDDQSRGLDR